MALAANAIVTAAEVRAYIKGAAADDSLFETISNNVADMFENYCDNYFVISVNTERYDGNNSNLLMLRHRPVTVLTQVKGAALWDDAVVLTLTDYEYNVETAVLRSKYASFIEGFQNFEIQYSSGYGANTAALPDDLKQAALKQIEFFYKRDSADFSATFAEGMIVKAPAPFLTPVVKGLLAPYRNMRVG